MTASISTNKVSFLSDNVSIPKDMSEALDSDDPVAALQLLAAASQQKADKLSADLQNKLTNDWSNYQLPSLLVDELSPNNNHPIPTAIACSDSIFNSLTKIASGGSQASQEIRQLEDAKQQVESHASTIAMALELRKDADVATQALPAESWYAAAEAVRPWLEWSQQHTTTTDDEDHDYSRCREYTGDYAIQQLETAHAQLSKRVLELFQASVEQGDLQAIGQLTPVLSLIQLDAEAVSLYLQFLKRNVLEPEMKAAVALDNDNNSAQQQQAPFAPMARVYNAAVMTLRHHLPLVSHCLYRADGDAAVVQLVHAQVEFAVLPLVQQYQRDRQLATVSQKAVRIYEALEERYTGRGGGGGGGLLEDATMGKEAEDCGFSTQIGTLADVDVAMEEAAIGIQQSESYLRFLAHTCSEINKARHLRWEREQQAKRWTTDDKKEEYVSKEIISPMTQLHQIVAEVGGQYAAIEHCLLLASMQRAFVQPETDPRYYQSLSTASSEGTSNAVNQAMQTAMIDTCFYAARHSTQRAFATGHTGTASAMVNFCVDSLNDILLEVLSHRAEESGVGLLKPGEGLLVGSAGIFNASNLIRQGATVAAQQHKDVISRKQQQQDEIAHACATINDLEVAVHHTNQLETILMSTLQKGFPVGASTEQLQMCVKSLRTVADGFKVASDSTIESLESVLKHRLRSIVGEAVGGEGGVGFMGSMGAGKSTDRVMARMNYNLDDDTYNLMQLSEGYVAHLCALLDELLAPLRSHLAPRLWDALLLTVMGTVSKRLETSLRKCDFTSLGALALDTDMRDLLNYTKDHLYGADFSSNQAVTRACPPLSRLLQISKLLNVDDLDDVIDLISSSKRKNNWDMKLDDAKAFLSARVEFEASKINELLRIPDDS